jgi:hypothetical protein
MANPVDPCEGVIWRIDYYDASGFHHVVEGVPQFPHGEGPCDGTIKIGADNPEYGGHAMGYSRESGVSNYCYSYYYCYSYKSSSTDYRGWAMFDLEDLTKWDGVEVTSAKLVFQNNYRYNVESVKFTTLDSIPYHNAPYSTALAVYNESGPDGTQIGQYTATDSVDANYHTIEVPLDTSAVIEINDVLSDSSADDYTFGVGMYIDSLFSGAGYGYFRYMDVRLELTFKYDEVLQPTSPGEGIAFGDDLTGHVYKYTSAFNRPHGYMYIRKFSTYEYRGYAQWGISDLSKAFNQVDTSNIKITKVSLRFNHYNSEFHNISINQMEKNVETASAEEIFTDCGDGNQYYGNGSTAAYRMEYEWDLGPDAVNDFQDALEEGDPDFFGIGFVATSDSSGGYTYDFSPKLVIEWELETP